MAKKTSDIPQTLPRSQRRKCYCITWDVDTPYDGWVKERHSYRMLTESEKTLLLLGDFGVELVLERDWAKLVEDAFAAGKVIGSDLPDHAGLVGEKS